MTGLVLLIAVLALASVLGTLWRRRQGVARRTARPADPGPEQAVADTALTALGVRAGEVTMLQFSSAFCAPCRATRAVLGSVAGEFPDVRHLEVDAESHLQQVRALSIRTTPTTLFVGPDGREAARASGAPRRAQVLAALAPLTAEAAAGPSSGPPVGTTRPDSGTAR